MARHRLGIRVLGPAIALMALGGLPVPPPALAQESAEIAEVSPADDPFELPPPPAPVTDEQRLPVLDLDDLEGLWPQDAVTSIGGEKDPTSPTDAIDEAVAEPLEGGENFDAFGVGPDGTDHVVLVYPDVVNEQGGQGKWRDVGLTLAEGPAGWSFSSELASVSFPSALSAATPVSLSFPEGALDVSLSGIEVKGTSDGASVTYSDIAPFTDLVYRPLLDGYAEDVYFRSAEATPSVSYEFAATGLSLVPNGFGGIDVLAAGALAAYMPAPIAYDSSPEPQVSVGTYALQDLGSGRYELTVSLDPEFMKAATYPVVLDPSVQKNPSRDGYTDADNPGTPFEPSGLLQVDQGERTYLRFDVDNQRRDERLVYDATLFLYPTSSGGVTGGIDAKRVLTGWPTPEGTLNWNNQPDVGQVIDTKSNDNPDGWWTWQLAELYQHYLDTSNIWNPHWTEYGVGLTASNPKSFRSSETTMPNAQPVLAITYNDLPTKPTANLPAGGYISETESPTLKVLGGSDWPTDVNTDDVLVGFEISDDGVNWTGSDLVFSSPLSDERSFTVPAGVLLDGQDYWWRAVSRDVCNPPEGPCALEDGAGTLREPNATSPRKITIALKHFGDDPRWAMWSHDVGNGMALKVNESNGNLFLDVPLESYDTSLGDLDLGLTYNSQQGADYGLSPGWDLAIGPSSSKRMLPIELFKLDLGDADVKIRFGGGRTLFFGHKDGNIYGASSANSGTVTRNNNDTWTYLDSSGGRFVFDSGAQNGAPLLRAKPSWSQDSAPDKSIDYAYVSGELSSVTDPLGRTVDLTWSGGRLEGITATGFGGQFFDLSYNGAGKLTGISTQVTNPSIPQTVTETLDFAYVGGTDFDAGLLRQVKDGEQAASGDGWDVTYLQDPNLNVRVSTVTAPDTGSPSSAPTPWTFRYFEPYKGTTAAGACITDPRGSPTSACDAEFASDDAFETQVDFAWTGQPVQITHPADQQGYRGVETFVFDSHNNLLCERSEAANALGGISPSCTSEQSGGEYTDLDDAGLSTLYNYQDQAPYRLMTKKYPAPDTSGYPRLKETYAYDAGTSFGGLWVEKYDNDDLSGLPDDESLWADLDEDWGGGAAPGVPGDGDHWSLRWTGWLDLQDKNNTKKYAFRLWSNDGSNLTVGNRTLTACFGTDQTMADYNCGSNEDVKKNLSPGLKPITIEYSERTGQAAMKLQWDQGTGDWQVIPQSRLKPNLGLLTTKTYSRVTAGGSTDLWEEGWTYPTDDRKGRRLTEVQRRTDLSTGGPEYRTRYDYNKYGQITQITDFDGTAKAATTTNTWRNGSAPWDPQLSVSCLERVVGPLGEQTDYECDEAGDQTKQTVTIRAVSGADQGAQTRVTRTEHDSLGRVTKTTDPAGGSTTTTYDLSGRVAQTDQLLSTGLHAYTNYAYDHAGHLRTETLPDPDGAGGASRPVISHEYNWVDLETRRIDARGKSWITSYDALNRAISETSPLGAVTETTYQLGSSVNRQFVSSPAGVDVTTDLDVLGRKTSEAIESYDPTTYSYDVLGNTMKVTDPAGIQTKSYFDNLSELTKRTDFFQGSAAADTTFTYDVAGRLKEIDGPRTDADDRVTYGYDLSGRLTSVTLPGVYLPSSSTPVSLAITYDDAGERVKVEQPMKTSLTLTRNWTYDSAGRVSTYRDAKGTTTYAYNLAGWPTQVADPRPQSVYFGYDNLGRRVCRHTATCTQQTTAAETYTYDAAGNMTKAKNPSVTYDMTFDDDGRLWKVFRNGSTTAETTYSYNATTAQLSSVSDAAGTTALAYNAAGQIATVDDPLVTGSAKSTYTYAPTSGRLATRTDAQSNLRWEQTYEPDTGRVDTLSIKNNTTSAVLASFDLGYDPAGNVTSKASDVFQNPADGAWSYLYDGAGRLTQATGPNASGAATTREYGYDGAGNRILAKETTGQTVTTNLSTNYDAAGLPTTASDSATGETVTYTHDNVGNLTKLDSSISTKDWAYTYDAYSRLTCAKQATGCASGTQRVLFALDPFDRAFTRTKGSSTTAYTYQGIGELAAKTQVGAGTPTYYAYTSGGSPLAQKSGSNAYFFLRDLHGDAVGLATTSAGNQGTASYDAWGKPLATTGTTSWLGFQGDPTDPDTRQVDMGARWYDPGLGRFSTRDALFGDQAAPMSLNQFVYAQANPVSMWDPTGYHANWKHSAGCRSGDRGLCWYHDNDNNPAPPGYDPDPWDDEDEDTVQGAPPVEYDPGDFSDDPEFLRVLYRLIDDLQDDPRYQRYLQIKEQLEHCSGILASLGCAWEDVKQFSGAAANFVDRAVGYAVLRPNGWLLGQINRLFGASSRPCGREATCYENSPLVPSGVDAWTLHHSIYCRSTCGETLVRHEMVHVEQYNTQGITFVVRYAYQAALHGTGCANPWEQEAYAVSGACS